MTQLLLEMLKYSLPALLVLVGIYVSVRAMLSHNERVKAMEMSLQRTELSLKMRQDVLPLRLQAYERLVLYLERTTPISLLTRLRQDGMSAAELQMAMIMTIRMEYEHNLAQQIYVSPEAWTVVQATTEESVSTLNAIANSLPAGASGNDFARALLEFSVAANQTLPSQKAIAAIKEEVMNLLVV